MSNIHSVNESDDFNVIKGIMSINERLASLNTKVDNFNDAVKVADDKAQAANHKSNIAYNLALKNKYRINDIKGDVKELKDGVDDKSNNHNQWWMAVISAAIGGVVGILPSITSLF